MCFRGVCTQAPCYCILMEYCAQGQLYEVLRAGRKITPSLLVDWAMGIAGGMNYLHLHKIIHRDLKSPKYCTLISRDPCVWMHECTLYPCLLSVSMLITHDDLVKISDFGTSKELRDKSTKMSFAGTVAWMAPEVIRNEPVSEKVDIWYDHSLSLGLKVIKAISENKNSVLICTCWGTNKMQMQSFIQRHNQKQAGLNIGINRY